MQYNFQHMQYNQSNMHLIWKNLGIIHGLRTSVSCQVEEGLLFTGLQKMKALQIEPNICAVRSVFLSTFF